MTALRMEVRMVLDLMTNQKHRSGMTPVRVGENLCRVFGGFTAVNSVGCWFDNGLPGSGDIVWDMSMSYSVAIPHTSWPEFKDLAVILADGQDTVYVVGPLGPEVLDVPGPFVEVQPTEFPFVDHDESTGAFGNLNDGGGPIIDDPHVPMEADK